jgi:hypothetical protein
MHHHTPGGRHEPSSHCGHDKAHSHLEAELEGSPLVSTRQGDWAAISGLFVMLTL